MALAKGKTRVAISVPLAWWRRMLAAAADVDRTPSQLLAQLVDPDQLRAQLLIPGTPWRPDSKKATAAAAGRPRQNPDEAPQSPRRRAPAKTPKTR